jgi:predicted nucleic acid-binding protein
VTEWIIDTGPLVAFFDRSDKFHSWAKEKWSHAPTPMVTCEPVLTEAVYLLQEHAGLAPEKVLALVERKVITVPFVIEEHTGALSRLLNRYRDQQMQLADACVVRLSELRRDSVVFTLDKEEFRIYRRFERQVIPLVAPE